MIPVALITGFLGSGKTTFLRRCIQRYRGKRIVYIVNEFSAVDVDGHVLEGETNELIALPGGSVFCRCLVTDFINVLRKVSGAGDGAPVDGVIIEASGIANPMVVEEMLQETQLDKVYALSSVVSIVDPKTFGVLLQSLPNVSAQVEASDVVVINKADLHPEDALADTEAQVRRINGKARLIRALYCEVDLDLFGPGGARGLHGEYAQCVDPNYARASVRLRVEVDIAKLEAAVQPLGDDLFRMKGFVRTPGGMRYVDYAAGALTTLEADGAARDTGLVFVARGAAQERLQELVGRIKAGAIALGDSA